MPQFKSNSHNTQKRRLKIFRPVKPKIKAFIASHECAMDCLTLLGILLFFAFLYNIGTPDVSCNPSDVPSAIVSNDTYTDVQETRPQSAKANSIPFGYAHVYMNPYVIALRDAFDSYLTTGVSPSATVDLSPYKDILSSKFVVHMVTNSLAGGKEITILFLDSPDAIYHTWVYELPDGTFELRGFAKDTTYTSDYVKQFVESNRELIYETPLSL